MPTDDLRNIAIIAHVDHGKTSLVDQMLRQSGALGSSEYEKLRGGQHGLVMDTNELERERGITILSKNCAITYAKPGDAPTRINIIDTPGHADFGGEVERILRMADGCLLLVDAFEGPMPQTRFVLTKALEAGLRPVVVINKCDRPDARPDEVVDEVFDLLVELGANDEALEFPVVYTSARAGWASLDHHHPREDLRDLFDMIVESIPPAGGDPDAPLQLLILSLDSTAYVGRIGIGRVFSGTIRAGQNIALLKRVGGRTDVKVGGLQRFHAMGRIEASEVRAGDICAVVGVEGVDIGDTIADPENAVALPTVSIDQPTITMIFRINDSPFAGREGEFVTSRQIRTRLDRELERNVALRVESSHSADEFIVSGRGLLHLGVLIETMRREGYELAVGKPRVILREVEGRIHEPIERVTIDCPEWCVGPVMELLGSRRGELKKLDHIGSRTRLHFEAPSRGLIGVRSRLLGVSQGEAIMHHVFDRYEPAISAELRRPSGVLVATETAQVTAHAVEAMSDRGFLFVRPGDKVYSGQIVGEHNRENDLTVNITREKKLTNIRSSTKEATITLKQPRDIALEAALEYIEDDELVEITPGAIRLRKKLLDEGARRRASRSAKDRPAPASA